MKQLSCDFFLIFFIWIISPYAQTKDIKVWVENKQQYETVKVYFDAVYSSEVGPAYVFPGVTRAFLVKN